VTSENGNDPKGGADDGSVQNACGHGAGDVRRRHPANQVTGKLDTWLLIHNVRIALAFAASALGVWAISR
tara:strand:+ start:4590 stop:4799 length:210 start_codon:yes stop_codon:yes gene_type:complete